MNSLNFYDFGKNETSLITQKQQLLGKQKKVDDAQDERIENIEEKNVISVNGKTGDVVLNAEDIGAYEKPSSGIPSTDLSNQVRTSLGKADTAIQEETDPTVPSWAKNTSKPSYTAAEVGALPDTTVIPEAQIQSDWDQNDSTKKDYIKNKPNITKNGQHYTFTSYADLTINAAEELILHAMDDGISLNSYESIRLNTPHGKANYNGKEIAVKDDIPSNISYFTNDVGYYKKPVNGIPASDLASGVIPDVSGKEDSSNKTNDIAGNKTNTTKYTTTKGVADYVDGILGDINSVLDTILGN